MSTDVMSPSSIDDELKKMMQQEEERTDTSNDLLVIKSAGTYRIRVLPNADLGPQFWRTYGLHFWEKGLIGNEKAIVFNSAVNTHQVEESADPILNAIKVAQREANKTDNEGMKKFLQKVSSRPYYVSNVMIVPDGQHVGEVQVLRFTKTMREAFFQAARMISMRFNTLEENVCLHIKFEEQSNGNWLKPTIVGREEAVNLLQMGFDPSKLANLDDVVENKTANAKSPESFSGDLFNPVIPASPVAGALPNGIAPVAAPAAIAGPTPVAPAAPAAPAAVQPATVVTAPTPVAPTPVAQPAPQPVAQPAQQPTPVAPVAQPTPVAQPVAQPATVAQDPAPQATPTPEAAQGSETQDLAALENELLEMAGASRAS